MISANVVMYKYLLRIFFPLAERPVPLGRWGYHFEKQRVYQKYYE